MFELVDFDFEKLENSEPISVLLDDWCDRGKQCLQLFQVGWCNGVANG
ncbi:hypothetical protein [Burkholderia ubonensis]|nr:hypothetical protein [Burkholderia ubonensis]